MRFFEILIFITHLIILVLFLLPRWQRPWQNFLPGVAFAFTLIHLTLEGYRWQMLPAYGLTLLFVLLMLKNIISPTAKETPVAKVKLSTIIASLGALIILSLSFSLAILLPIPHIPSEMGAYPVGTTIFHWTDPSRDEIYTANPTDKREIMIQFWYPAQAPLNDVTPWMSNSDVVAPSIAKWLGLPPFILNHFNLIYTNSFADAPLSNTLNQYPVIVYSHGWGGFRMINVDQVETLASHGYIVVTIDHTYGAMATVFPDEQIAMINPDALPDRPEDEIYWQAANTLVDVFAADVRFVLDQLAHLEAGDIDSPFANHLDLERVGLFGHSTGGGAIVEVCSLDPRCKAGLGQDAWVRPVSDAVIEQGLSQPFLFMRSDPWSQGKNEDRLKLLYNTLPQDGYRMTIAGAAHRDFTLLPLLSPVASTLGLKGPINGKRGLHIINTYLLAFFEKHLQNKEAPLLNGPSADYPEVIFEKKNTE